MVWQLGDRIGGVTAMEETSGATMAFAAESRICRCPSSTTLPSPFQHRSPRRVALGTPPLSLEVRLDAVAAVLLDGLSYRRAGRMIGISKTEVGDSLDLLLGELAALGLCQPDGTFVCLSRWLHRVPT
jgi:hypothetical protein